MDARGMPGGSEVSASSTATPGGKGERERHDFEPDTNGRCLVCGGPWRDKRHQ